MHRTRTPILALALCLSLAIPALAQGPLSDDIITAGSLSPAQLSRVTDFARQYQDDLLSDDPLAVQRARKRLSEPLTKDAVSLSFRRTYSDQLMGVVRPGSRSSNEHVAANSLLLAGRLATPEALDVLERALGEERVPVRYAAIAGITLLIAQVNDNAPAIFNARVEEIVGSLGQVVRVDPEPTVVDAAVRALVAAARQTQYDNVSAAALRSLPQAIEQRLGDYNGPPEFQLLTAAIRAAEAMRTILIQDVGNTRTQVAIDAARLAGHELAFVARHLDQGHLPPAGEDDPEARRTRDAAAQMIALSEAIIILVNSDYLSGRPIDAWNLAEDLQAGDNVAERIRADIIGRAGVLTEPPFTFDDDEFVEN